MHCWQTSRLRIAILLSVAALLLSLVPSQPLVASSANPARVAIESVGLARETGYAVVHIATSQATQVRVIPTDAPGEVVAEFADAVLAPNADGALRSAPSLREAITITQATLKPPVVWVKLVSVGGTPPEIERFADYRGLLVKLRVGMPRGMEARTSTALPYVSSDRRASRILIVDAAPASPLVAPAPPLIRSHVAGKVPPLVARPRTGMMPDPLMRLAAVPAMVLCPPLSATPGSLEAILRGNVAPSPAYTTLQVPEVLGTHQTTDARSAPTVSTLARALTSVPGERPSPPLPESPAPEPAASGVVQQVRVVGLSPLRVAIDCSQPMPYRLERHESPYEYIITFPGATLEPRCLRAVALQPARSGTLTVEETAEGAQIIIPAAPGEVCQPKAGASARTVVCELISEAATALAQRPAPQPQSAQKNPDQGAESEEPLINVDFQEAPLVEILTALAKYADKNVITTTSVSGTMSVHLSRVTLTQALDLITALNNLEYALVGDRNYVVGTTEEIARVRGVGPGALPLDLVYKPQNTTPERIARELADVIEPLGVTIKIVEDAKSMVFMNLPDEKTAEWLRERAAQVDVPPIETTRWIQLEHLTPAQAASALEGLTPDVEVLVPGPEAPQVPVVGLSGKSVDVDQAEQLLSTIDVETLPEPPAAGPVVMEAVYVSYADPEAVVQLITSMYGEQVEAYLATGTSELQDIKGSEEAGGIRRLATVVLRGAQSAVDAVKELLAKVDAPPPQVQITATITDIGVDKDKRIGFEWDLPGLIFSEEKTAGDGFKVGKISRAPFKTGAAGSFASTFDAVLSQINATVLSRTKLVAVNGKSANFLVGDIVPYEVAVAGDGTVTRSVEFEEIGLGLKFAPSVDAEGHITIFLSPQVRSFSGFTPQGYPIVATREAQTIVRVSDGDVIAIGGLLRDEEIKTLSGIPFLKDIPLFGELFKRRQTQRKKSEVVVFAEVKLLRPENQPVGGEVSEVGQG